MNLRDNGLITAFAKPKHQDDGQTGGENGAGVGQRLGLLQKKAESASVPNNSATKAIFQPTP